MKFKTLIFASLTILFFACDSSESVSERFRLSKMYWNLDDYKHAVHEITYANKDEKTPCYAIPEMAPVFMKIVDKNNIKVVTEDNELGLSHRANYTEEMFKQHRHLMKLYRGIDREDKFVYPMELTDLLKFGLYGQLHYFDLGNQLIRKNSDDPKAAHIQQTLRSNEKIIIGNFCLYLDYIKQESSFSTEAFNSYNEGINEYFPLLIKTFPKGNFYELEQKIVTMSNKTESEKIKASLTNLQTILDTKKEEKESDKEEIAE